MKFLVTAFGPFGGRKTNASMLVLARLKKTFPEIHTRTLPVDAVTGPARLRRAIRHLRPGLLVMLGEAGGSHEIRLETTAWNELDFRIPDNDGRQPVGKPIHKGAPRSLRATLPIDRIHAALTEAGHPVEISEDPGRYLCNQVFYTALHSLKAEQIHCKAGFIHLPLEHDFSTDRAADAITRILREHGVSPPAP